MSLAQCCSHPSLKHVLLGSWWSLAEINLPALAVLMQRLLRSLVVFPAWLSPAFCVCLSQMTNVGPWRPFRGVGLWHSRAGSTKVLSVMVTPKHQVVQECGGSRKPCAASRFFLPECKWEKPSKVLVCVWFCFSFPEKKKDAGPEFWKACAFTGVCTEMVPVKAELNGRWHGGLRIYWLVQVNLCHSTLAV